MPPSASTTTPDPDAPATSSTHGPPTIANNAPSASQSSASAEAESAPSSPKPHLSEEQKKANHIASEKKRRTNIREQYDKLAEMTPGMEGQGRSEGKVLEEVVKHGRELQRERQKLIEEIERKGGVVGEELRKF